MKELKDKVAVITGAASGIGRAMADRCVQEGMKVVLADEGGLSRSRSRQAVRIPQSNYLSRGSGCLVSRIAHLR